jgi:hypothetical protein
VLDALKLFLEQAKTFRAKVKALRSRTVGQTLIRKEAEEIGSEWCNSICPQLKANGGFDSELLATYTTQFERLIKLSAPSNRRSSYLLVLDSATKHFREHFILPVQQGKIEIALARSSFDEFLARIATMDEGEYFKEALSCARNTYFRAATVMGWCAAIDRIHRKVDESGVARFNVVSAQMASQQSGRFKKFNQTQNVKSLSDLREVFDTTILWVIEGMGLIDSNQHTRLRSCFEMRCHAAHPGEAPMTEYNLLSFFSDIEQIILSNPTFTLSEAGGT